MFEIGRSWRHRSVSLRRAVLVFFVFAPRVHDWFSIIGLMCENRPFLATLISVAQNGHSCFYRVRFASYEMGFINGLVFAIDRSWRHRSVSLRTVLLTSFAVESLVDGLGFDIGVMLEIGRSWRHRSASLRTAVLVPVRSIRKFMCWASTASSRCSHTAVRGDTYLRRSERPLLFPVRPIR